MRQWLQKIKEGRQAIKGHAFWKWYEQSGAKAAFSFFANMTTLYLVYYIVSQGETIGRSIDCQTYHPLIVAGAQCPYGIRADVCVPIEGVVWNQSWANRTGVQTQSINILNREQVPMPNPSYPEVIKVRQ